MTDPHADSGPETLARLANGLRDLRPEFPASRFAGRGIVVAAGGSRMFTNAYVLVSVLRNTLGSTLPVEIWHFGASEMSPAMAALMGDLGADLIDASPLIAERGAGISDGWQLKPFALMWSRYREVLLLDADQVPVVDPRSVFDWPDYQRESAVFWPDVLDIRESNPVWAQLGLPPRRSTSLDSGQVLVDKARHWRALSVCLRLNEEAGRIYRLIYGDKDTFLVGWMLANARYALAPHPPYVDERYLVQRDVAGRPLFQHRTNAKWTYGGRQPDIKGFVHQTECLAALDHLAKHWNGRVFNAPGRGAAAIDAEDEVCRLGRFILETPDENRLTIELRRFGEIGAGRAYDRQNWWVEEWVEETARRSFRLVMSDGDRRTYEIDQVHAAHWQGIRRRPPDAPVVLRAAAQWESLPSARSVEVPSLVDDFLRVSGFPLAAGADAEMLAAGLLLLSRVDNGVAGRLAFLAQAQAGADPAAAARLTRMRDLVTEADRPHLRREVGRDLSVLHAGYVPSVHVRPD